jgi:hypothetical protein
VHSHEHARRWPPPARVRAIKESCVC